VVTIWLIWLSSATSTQGALVHAGAPAPLASASGPGAGLAANGAASATSNEKVLPRPGVLCAVIVPPIKLE